MRYRPFGHAGKVVSAISLLLRETGAVSRAGDWRAATISGLENGINCFELCASGDGLAAGVRNALATVDRRLVLIGWRIEHRTRMPLNGRVLRESVDKALSKTGAEYFDNLMLEENAVLCLTPDGHQCLADLKSSGLCKHIGIVGEGDAVDLCFAEGVFDVLSSSCDLTSENLILRQLKRASDQGTIVIARNAVPEGIVRASRVPVARKVGNFFGFGRGNVLAGVGTFQFLHNTPGWKPEDICLACLLTEPAMATVMIEARKPEVIAHLATITERELPTGIPAQLEMARFSSENMLGAVSR